MNLIDQCWRKNPKWWTQRQHLASCSVGYAGKMTNNVGGDVIQYKVTDPSDNPVNPNPGTLRYGVTHLSGKVWITFQKGMRIKLEKPLIVSSFTTIDGRGANVHIAGGAGLLLKKVTNVIIHGLVIHHIRPHTPGAVMGPGKKMETMDRIDGDAIRLVTSSKVWIDHNTLFECEDGLIDVTRGSTGITISNNWFRNHNKVMLLGHDDGFLRDKEMKVTVVFNHFGPNCKQRMPRVRHGYAHVVNNLYQGWGLYAIGGSMNPSVKSEANLFIAPNSGNKEVTWRKNNGRGMVSNFQSVRDVFENGACFSETSDGDGGIKPNYNHEQYFQVADARTLRSLTRFSGALKCRGKSRC
ncbi:probable pectate lyase 16 [Cornus florida]|uniref:probable pectate lyase 16 n=1 Tax=Cornus florida TaxID=4283 RepID=UPI00289B426E|nr:probable pectate lyase 16 [Cornus florida]